MITNDITLTQVMAVGMPMITPIALQVKEYSNEERTFYRPVLEYQHQEKKGTHFKDLKKFEIIGWGTSIAHIDFNFQTIELR